MENQMLNARLEVKLNDEETFADYVGRAMIAKTAMEVKNQMMAVKYEKTMDCLKVQSEIREELEFKFMLKKRDP